MRVHHHPRPGAWLQVDHDGRWDAADATPAARDLFDLFVPLRVPPLVTIGQAGQSLDGRIATESGDSHYITGRPDIRRLHRLRAMVDAVIVGAETVAMDNPQLSVREVEGDDPIRVVLDPHGRLDGSLRVFSDAGAPTIVIHRHDPGQPCPPESPHVISLPGDAAHGRIAPQSITRALHHRGLKRLLVEGGGTTLSAFLEAGVLDRLHVTVAPILIGSGRSAFRLAPIASLDRAIRAPCRYFRLGDDILFDLDLRPSAASPQGSQESPAQAPD